jgi:hypothetical protein
MSDLNEVGAFALALILKVKYLTMCMLSTALLYLVTMWLPTQPFSEVLFLTIGLNLTSGIYAAYKKGDRFEWKKFLLIPLKCVLYPMAVMVINKYQVVFVSGIPMTHVVAATLAGAELLSAAENYEKIFGVSFVQVLATMIKEKFPNIKK